MGSSKLEKKEKKEKKRSESDGVSKPKKDKKDKKDRKEKLAAALDEQLQADAAASAAESGVLLDGSEQKKLGGRPLVPPGALVPFAVPIADDKVAKRVLKVTRKAAKNNSLKRGVKEVVKTLRKSPKSAPAQVGFLGVVVIAGDISPMDVISHLPVHCEDHNVPYIFVTSRAELGAAAKTKRPTSVVMIMEKPSGKGRKEVNEDDGEDDGEDYSEAYSTLVKTVNKETERQNFW